MSWALYHPCTTIGLSGRELVLVALRNAAQTPGSPITASNPMFGCKLMTHRSRIASRSGSRARQTIQNKDPRKVPESSKKKRKNEKSVAAERIELWVEQILYPNVLSVSPGWALAGKKGREIRIRGIDSPHTGPRAQELKESLAEYVLGGSVEIAGPFSMDSEGRLVCDVFASGKKLTTQLLDRRAHA